MILHRRKGYRREPAKRGREALEGTARRGHGYWKFLKRILTNIGDENEGLGIHEGFNNTNGKSEVRESEYAIIIRRSQRLREVK